MRVGDKRQAGILGAVAVAAIGFLIFQLVPKADAHQSAAVTKPPVASSEATPSTPVAPIPASGEGVPLRRDPFTVARHATPKPSVIRSQAEPSPDEGTVGDSSLLPPAQVGPLPRFVPPQSSPGDEPGEEATPKPRTKSSAGEKPATKAIDSPVPPVKTIVELLGVVEMPTPIAMVRVGPTERTLRVGDEIVPGFRIATITLEGITFLDRPGVHLAPGEETNL